MAEIGLAAAAATADQLKKVLNLVPEEKGRPKFGYVVDPQKEAKCPYLEVFMACHGRTDTINIISGSAELRRGRFKPNDTPLDARDGFGEDRGNPVSQEDILDENGYIIENKLLNLPMSTLSNGCRLNLNFVYRRNVLSDAVVKSVEKTDEIITDAGQKVRDAATNTQTWWQGWKSNSSTPELVKETNDRD